MSCLHRYLPLSRTTDPKTYSTHNVLYLNYPSVKHMWTDCKAHRRNAFSSPRPRPTPGACNLRTFPGCALSAQGLLGNFGRCFLGCDARRDPSAEDPRKALRTTVCSLWPFPSQLTAAFSPAGRPGDPGFHFFQLTF